mmetsp:Transcript_4499/g.4967  ORF Transcript_4499/g.4967 Transcript_4499/m.4967 type:complete len:246 (+) Transcript_4499:51-788(+)|eukprot:CAMPEP_0176425540 /NCGR_PEP_ID=MMETSP0127-20121128/11446_1 /TAXON_ID=938130 /ORGANISM="Platyophrya macrostoma, Strain WH" /LENGTH=245 /DNA_ID=CAMNT_0017806713 /DNA_START=51 /DNA_END=788 /DNA_ORIENTATION=+
MIAKNKFLSVLRSSVFKTQQYCFSSAQAASQNPYTQDLKVLTEAPELTEDQKKRTKMIAQAYLALDEKEVKYFKALLRNKVQRTMGIDLKTYNPQWPFALAMQNQTIQTEEQTKFEKRLESLSPLGQAAISKAFSELFGTATGGMGRRGGAGAQQAGGEQAEAKQEETKAPAVEKTSFEVQLTSFDAAQKIKIIKEIRELTKLGLKEAKEMVEKAPISIKKDVKKEEAETLKEKLEAAGCVITLL